MQKISTRKNGTTISSTQVKEQTGLFNSVPKDTSRHPFRKQNNSLKQYSLKALAEKKKQNL